MKVVNIFEENRGLEIHKDHRGVIADVFFGELIHHVAKIDSKAGVIRGNHFHALSTQHILITQGSLEYWYKNVDSEGFGSVYVTKVGDLVTTPPNEVHALRIGEYGCEFLAFTSGPRGGSDYESDTFRVDSIIDLNMKK
jgi:quercetin dioxygenase-like cupin family protein